MADYPETVREFRAWFPDEAACRTYLEQVRWPTGPRCPRCPQAEVWKMQPPFYRCALCRHDFTVTAGTLFADTRLPLTLWFEALWHVVHQKHGASALGVQRVLGVSYLTAWRWLHKLRRAMVRPGRDRLAGSVEVDEVYVGGERPGKRGRGAAGKALVLIAAQTDGSRIGRIRMARVADASQRVLTLAVQGMVEPKAQVLTDGWDGYGLLADAGYEHLIVRKDAIVGKNLLPRANRVAALLQRWLLGTHQGAVAHSHLDYYLDEFVFRFNRRRSRYRGLLFYRLIEQSLALAPVRCQTLVGGTEPQGIGVGGTM
ncbi:MAG: IS1595 family transposase [Betaproteobacteria bacterium]|jgi:transposase-like protein|nr:IS1595 family transposase [Betaproteobacteria bacterium]